MTEPTKEQIKELKEIWTDYGRLYKADYKLCCHSRGLFKKFQGDILPCVPKNISGSTQTGSALARWFQNCGSTLMEWDIMYNIARIYCSCKSTVDDISEHPGYAKVRSIDMKGRGYCNFDENSSEFRSCLLGNKYINGDMVKEKLKECLVEELNKPAKKAALKKAFKDIFGVDSVRIPTPGDFKKDGVSIVFIMEAKDGKNKEVRFDCDNIASIHCQIYWPSEAGNWDKTFKNEIQYANGRSPVLTFNQAHKIRKGGCHIIPKSLSDEPQSWRWSVSMAEAEVQDHFSEEQDLAYLITKIIFYNLKKNLDGFTSFLIKNIAFNIFVLKYGRKNKRKPTKPNLQGNGNHNQCNDTEFSFDWEETIWMVMVLLQEVILCFERRRLNHFFMKRVELTQKISSESARREIIDAFKYIINNITNKRISLPCSDDINDVIYRVDLLCANEETYEAIIRSERSEGYPHCNKHENICRGLNELSFYDDDYVLNAMEKIQKLQQAFNEQHYYVQEDFNLQQKIKHIKSSMEQQRDADSLIKLQEELKSQESLVKNLNERFSVSEFLLRDGRSLRIGKELQILQDDEQGTHATNMRMLNQAVNPCMTDVLKQNSTERQQFIKKYDFLQNVEKYAVNELHIQDNELHDLGLLFLPNSKSHMFKNFFKVLNPVENPFYCTKYKLTGEISIDDSEELQHNPSSSSETVDLRQKEECTLL